MGAACDFCSDLGALLAGCRSESDQKCVIDNHEVEILHTPGSETPHYSGSSLCPSGRVDFCSPSPRPPGYEEQYPATSFLTGSGLTEVFLGAGRR
eukprot:NODE_9103_length_1446_cov_9.263078.p7 GENE.NODE_9103_length_1446_cov_9.263078~~NODE_9103_length_1446_cov_9.263078.p7  ORF type:complete len:95 (-),score=28.90 NODE_9103_length_1446_cov_9.263078:1087-1371(-)